MATYYATCHTPDNLDRDRRIQGLGGTGPMGAPFWFDIDRIIGMIDSGHHFWTKPLITAGQLIVVKKRPGILGRRYLTTIADGEEPNNILMLPRCPQR